MALFGERGQERMASKRRVISLGLNGAAIKQNEAGVRELRSLIERYPNSPEAVQARSR